MSWAVLDDFGAVVHVDRRKRYAIVWRDYFRYQGDHNARVVRLTCLKVKP